METIITGAPTQVLVFYASLVVSLSLLMAREMRKFFYFQVIILLWLNSRYFIGSIEEGITFFISIYDPLHNFGANYTTAVSLTECDYCSMWPVHVFSHHPSWGKSFLDRFSDGNQIRLSFLFSHIGLNTVAFVTMMLQFYFPGPGKYPRLHKFIGYTSVTCVTLGVGCAARLASEHSTTITYGGPYAMFGFYFLGLCSVVPALLGLFSILRGYYSAHVMFMHLYAGGMWGAYWVFRVLEFVAGPVLRDIEAASLLICIWGSGPIGLWLGYHYYQRYKQDHKKD